MVLMTDEHSGKSVLFVMQLIVEADFFCFCPCYFLQKAKQEYKSFLLLKLLQLFVHKINLKVKTAPNELFISGQ